VKKSLGFRRSAACWNFARTFGVERIVLTLHRAFKMRPAFDRDCLVDDVTLNTCSRSQTHFQATYTANDATVDDNVISNDFAFDRRGFPDCQQVRTNVALDSAFDLNVAGCL
jgi:hypothetical protein